MQAHIVRHLTNISGFNLHIFAHMHGAPVPRKLSSKLFPGALRSPAAHPPCLLWGSQGAGEETAPIYPSLFLNHRILCLRPWKERESGWGV